MSDVRAGERKMPIMSKVDVHMAYCSVSSAIRLMESNMDEGEVSETLNKLKAVRDDLGELVIEGGGHAC